jgi:hypothetical protein
VKYLHLRDTLLIVEHPLPHFNHNTTNKSLLLEFGRRSPNPSDKWGKSSGPPYEQPATSSRHGRCIEHPKGDWLATKQHADELKPASIRFAYGIRSDQAKAPTSMIRFIGFHSSRFKIELTAGPSGFGTSSPGRAGAHGSHSLIFDGQRFGIDPVQRPQMWLPHSTGGISVTISWHLMKINVHSAQVCVGVQHALSWIFGPHLLQICLLPLQQRPPLPLLLNMPVLMVPDGQDESQNGAVPSQKHSQPAWASMLEAIIKIAISAI